MITSYQVRNVLRIYGNQLKRKTLPVKTSVEPASYRPDFVDISMEARKKQMICQISNNIISQIDQNNFYEEATDFVPAKNSMKT